jgi:nitrite transporter
MYQDVLEAIAIAAVSKVNLLKTRPFASLVHSMMAGAYVGLGILLIFMLGTPLFLAKSLFQPLVMAAAFGVALSLVIMAGADLFTGTIMVMPVGALRGRCSWMDVLRVSSSSYVGNLIGSVLVAYLAYAAGIFADTSLVDAVASKKIHLNAYELLARGILCNWLVVWLSGVATG